MKYRTLKICQIESFVLLRQMDVLFSMNYYNILSKLTLFPLMLKRSKSICVLLKQVMPNNHYIVVIIIIIILLYLARFGSFIFIFACLIVLKNYNLKSLNKRMSK